MVSCSTAARPSVVQASIIYHIKRQFDSRVELDINKLVVSVNNT